MSSQLRSDQKLQPSCNLLKGSRLLICLCSILLCLAGSFLAHAQQVDSGVADPRLANFELISGNEYLRLYLNPETTEIAIQDIQTENLWFSNPQERFKTSGFVLNRLSSQLTIVHDPNGVQKDNHRYSIAYNQFDITPIDHGVRIDYTIVEEWKPEHYVPKMIRKTEMETEILAKIEKEEDRNRILEYYNLVMLVPRQGQPIPIPGVDHDQVFGDYDLVVLNPDYLEREAQLNTLKQALADLSGDPAELEKEIKRLEGQLNKEREDIVWRLINTYVECRLDIEKSDYVTFADLAHLIDNPTYVMELVPRFSLTSVQKIIIETGYTPIECAEDHLDNNLDPLLPNLEIFKVPMEYILDGANLVVRIPAQEVEYPVDVQNRVGEKFTYPLHTIRVLENFSAADTTKEGYMFVPDGSGALIYLNNKRLSTSGYNEPVYGRDNALDSLNELNRYPEVIRLPVFGLKQDDQAIFGIIEEGASLARIKADISGRTDNYNRVYAEFTLIPYSKVSLNLQTDNVRFSGELPTYQARKYEGVYEIRYAFLSGDDATYAGMARYYRDYLIDKYQLERVAPREQIPFYLELIGAIDKREPILGIARNVVHPLTTFKQARLILESLQERGIGEIQLKYNGWLNGGLDHHYPVKAALEKSLGGAVEFAEFVDYVNSQGYWLYPSVGLLSVYRTGLFDGFSVRNDAATQLNQLRAKVYQYRLNTHDRNPNAYYYVLSPRRIDSLVDSFLKDYQRYSLAGISLLDLGAEINSDFKDNPRDVIDREQALAIILAQFEKLRKQNMRIMVDHGNSYTLAYADAIVDLPSKGSSYHIVDEEIPFYQMVIHGLIDYTTSALNLSSNSRADLLRMLESGSYPYFVGCYEDSFEVKDTKFDHLFALHYGDWLNLAASIYRTVNDVLDDVQDQLIVDHCRLIDNVYQTTYENGKRIIVNYNKHAVEVYGRVIDGEDFIVLEAEADEIS